MTTLEILRAARELIATPERWTQGAGSRDADGVARNFNEPSVTCRCLYMAVSIAAGNYHQGQLDAFWALGFREQSHVVGWNDAPERTHAEVMALFDAAIQAEEAKVGK